MSNRLGSCRGISSGDIQTRRTSIRSDCQVSSPRVVLGPSKNERTHSPVKSRFQKLVKVSEPEASWCRPQNACVLVLKAPQTNPSQHHSTELISPTWANGLCNISSRSETRNKSRVVVTVHLLRVCDASRKKKREHKSRRVRPMRSETLLSPPMTTNCACRRGRRRSVCVHCFFVRAAWRVTPSCVSGGRNVNSSEKSFAESSTNFRIQIATERTDDMQTGPVPNLLCS